MGDGFPDRSPSQHGGGHRDIVQEVAVQFLRGVANGRVYAGDDAVGWLYRVTQRTTWRLAHAKALVLLCTVLPLTNGDLVEPEPPRGDNGHWAGSPEERAEYLEALEQALRGLTPNELLLLEVEIGRRDRGEVLEALRMRVEAARTKLSRLRSRLRAGSGEGERVARHGPGKPTKAKG